jgi:hypothetical protein
LLWEDVMGDEKAFGLDAGIVLRGIDVEDGIEHSRR